MMQNFNILEFDLLESTNVYAKENIHQLNHFDVILASRQTRGKGRFQRSWESPRGNLYFTIILKQNLSRSITKNITQLISLSLCRTLKEYGINPEIKWPNDVMVSEKKISGILCENILGNGKINSMILGTGINVNMSNSELKTINQPATSIKKEISKDIELKQVLNKFLVHFHNFYSLTEASDFNAVFHEWRQYLKFKDNTVKISQGENSLTGNLIDVNFDGSLKLNVNGEIKNIFSGDLL